MQLDRLTAESVIMPFDCGDDDLNAFLMNDAKAFMQKKIANTFTNSQSTYFYYTRIRA